MSDQANSLISKEIRPGRRYFIVLDTHFQGQNQAFGRNMNCLPSFDLRAPDPRIMKTPIGVPKNHGKSSVLSEVQARKCLNPLDNTRDAHAATSADGEHAVP